MTRKLVRFEENSLKSDFKKKFQKAFKSQDISHPLFDASKTEAKRLLITKKGLDELKSYDPSLHKSLTKWVKSKKLSSQNVRSKVEKWITQLKIRTGATKNAYRRPTRVYNTLSKVGSVNRPLALVHMDLADVNRLNPDNRTYRYPFILVTVDGFSNYVVLVPVKNKTASEVLNASKNAFSQLGLKSSRVTPTSDRTLRSGKIAKSNLCQKNCMITTRIQTDRGTEFINKEFKSFLKSRGYELFSSRGSGKAYLAESKIGQMKRQLVRIQNILEDSAKKQAKRNRKRNKQKSGKTKRKQGKSQAYNGDENDFTDFKEYKDDWSKHLRKLQEKINNKVNTRTGFTPKQLFTQFSGNKTGGKKDIEKREKGLINENETTKRFEPISDTVTKMILLRKGQNIQRAKKKKLERIVNKSKRKGKDSNLSWKREELKPGDLVYLTYSRLAGYPNEKPMNLFEKKSTQTRSEWNTDKTYVVDKVIKYTGEKNIPYRYRVKNRESGKMRKTLYYREELLLKKKT